LVAVSWSSNLRKGFSTLAAVSRISIVELRFIGHWPSEIIPENVILLGPKPSEQVAEILRQSNAMIHAAENEPCSNAIIEALACGLPVLYRDSGGNRELAREYGIALTDELEDNLSELMVHYYDLRDKLRQDHSKFLIDYVVKAYLAAFEEAMQMVGKRGK